MKSIMTSHFIVWNMDHPVEVCLEPTDRWGSEGRDGNNNYSRCHGGVTRGTHRHHHHQRVNHTLRYIDAPSHINLNKMNKKVSNEELHHKKIMQYVVKSVRKVLFVF